jgi:hypothetical protein
MYKLIEHHIGRTHIGGSYEAITESWHLHDPDNYGKYTIVTQRTAIGENAVNWRTYNRQGMRNFDDSTTNKVKKEIIQEVKDWFDKTSFTWLDL